jgi:hypothetical protein
VLLTSETEPSERATGLEPATSSLGSMSCSYAWRSLTLKRRNNDAGCTHTRSRVAAYTPLRVPQACPRSHRFILSKPEEPKEREARALAQNTRGG